MSTVRSRSGISCFQDISDVEHEDNIPSVRDTVASDSPEERETLTNDLSNVVDDDTTKIAGCFNLNLRCSMAG
ncbi:hypothetical protein ARMSODRAFT_1088643 [Armillaria solidipes]|uniref:Uncharacterized protein n=1 Tax=Armillaria solidipes TaxID=1076256 RepID=A0A2H3AXB3_9AGAR|nr:hypothetical protein ARMSODRAFT_1088643 [Armillaria solidipes]